MALADGVKEAMWVQNLLSELQAATNGYVQVDRTITACVDNESAMALTKEGAPHQRTKHIDVRYRYITEKVKDKSLHVEWVSTHHQLADVMTKRIPDASFIPVRDHLLAANQQQQPITLQQYRERSSINNKKDKNKDNMVESLNDAMGCVKAG